MVGKLATGMRGYCVLAHRWVGLLLASFLVMAGITGSLLAWNGELDAAINPQLFHAAPAQPGAAALAPLALRAAVQQRHPDALVTRVPLATAHGKAAVFTLRQRPGSPPLPNDQVFVNPYNGQILGERRWGDITQGWCNLMPFIYRLHYSLALDAVGTLVLGIVALLWTVDCLVGLYLTFPPRAPARAGASRAPARTWLARWGSAWKISLRNRQRAVFDLHRSGGLWPWIALLLLAWSSVALNLPQLYEPLMRALATPQRAAADAPMRSPPLWSPALDWDAAHARARALMSAQARRLGFEIEAESSLSYDPRRGLYRYDVRSSLDIKDKGGSTRIFVDGDSGALAGTWLPTQGAAPDTVTTWLMNLHMAATGGLAMKLAISALGLCVAALSLTGILIWARRKKARKAAGAIGR